MFCPAFYSAKGTISADGEIPLNEWNAALELVAANTADAMLLCVGDSTTEGTGGTNSTVRHLTSYTARLAQLMRDQNWNVIEAGISPPFGADENAEWDVTGWNGQEFGFRACAQSGTIGLELTYTPQGIISDTYDVYYIQVPIGGEMTITATGGTPVVRDTNGSAAVGMVTVSAASAEDDNMVTIEHTAGDNIFILAIQPRLAGTKSILISNVGVGGTKSSDWANQPLTAYQPLLTIETFAADLVIEMLGINDARTARTKAQFKLDMGLIVDAGKANGDVLICSVIPSDPSETGAPALEAEYREACIELAAAKGARFVDIWTAFGSAYNAPLMSDTVHANDDGYQLVAETIFAPIDPGEGPVFSYLRPGGVDTYKRPGGTDSYLRP